MHQLDWERVRTRFTLNPVSRTKNGKPFKVSKITDSAIYIDLPCGEQSVSRAFLEKAVDLINEGKIIEGPADYKRLVYDERPSYAWAILRDLGFIKE